MQTSIHIDGRPPTPPAEEVVGILLKGDKNTSPARAGNKRVTFGFYAPKHLGRVTCQNNNNNNDSTSGRRDEVLVPGPRPKGAGRVSWEIALPVSPLDADVALDCTPFPSPPNSVILALAPTSAAVDLSTAMPGAYPTSIITRSFTAISLAVFAPYLLVAQARLATLATFAQSIFTTLSHLIISHHTILTCFIQHAPILALTAYAIISEAHLSLGTRSLIALFGISVALVFPDYLAAGGDEEEMELLFKFRIMRCQKRIGVTPRVTVGGVVVRGKKEVVDAMVELEAGQKEDMV